MRLPILLNLAAFLIAAPAQAVPPLPMGGYSCPPSPSLPVEPMPEGRQVLRSNNLAQPAGKAAPANGQLLLIEGLVRDTHCRPVVDAPVMLWQRDPAGEYAYPGPAALNSPEPVFAGSGQARTDQYGRFRFHTLFPGAPGDLAPYVNIALRAGEAAYESRVYFAGDRRNEGDPVLGELPPGQRQAVEAQIDPSGGIPLPAHVVVTIDASPRFQRH